MSAPLDGCQMTLGAIRADGPEQLEGRACGATPTVGGNGLYRYCEGHFRMVAGAGATTLVRDDPRAAAITAEAQRVLDGPRIVQPGDRLAGGPGDIEVLVAQDFDRRADIVMVAKIDPREPRALYDANGNKIGEVTVDGDTGTARITDPAVVAAIKAQAAAGGGFSMGYRVTLEPMPAQPTADPDGDR